MCEMSKYQYTQYRNKLMSSSNKHKNNNNNNNNNNSNRNSNYNSNNNSSNNSKKNSSNIENTSYTRLQPLFYICNIILPNKNGDNVRASKEGHAYQKFDNGEGAFILNEKVIPKNKKKYYQFKYQRHLIFNNNTKNESSFLDEENLSKYSTKYYNALQNIKKGKGICYVYSEFVWGGVLPFSLMLEQNGFARYVIDSEKSLLDYPVNKYSKGGKKNPICAICSKYANNSIHTNSNLADFHVFKVARYILVTGDINLSRIETSQLMQIINNNNNKYGEEVKVIIGTKTTGEGLDFKRIRQVHILEPWYNLSRIDQIIGRAARNCSHIDLPKTERNVEIFLYATKPPSITSKKERDY